MASGVSLRSSSAVKEKRAKASQQAKKVCSENTKTQVRPEKPKRKVSAGTLLEAAFAIGKELRTACCRLSSVCSDARLVEEIQLSVRDMKQVQMETWHLVNLHTLRCLENRLQLPVYDKTFFDHCLSGVASTAYTHSIAAKDRLLWESIETYRNERRRAGLEEVSNHIGYTFLKSAMRQQMEVNATLMIRDNFKRRLREYVLVRFGTLDDDAPISEKKAKKRLVNEVVASCFNIRETSLVESLQMRDILSEGGQPWSEQTIPWPDNIENNLNFYVLLTWEFQVAVEARMKLVECEKGVKAFSIFPVSRSYIGAHIQINGSTLAGFYQRIRVRDGHNVLDEWRIPGLELSYHSFSKNKWTVMRTAFSIEHLETMRADSPLRSTAEFRSLSVEEKYAYASHLFANSISTDGYSASVHYYTRASASGDDSEQIPPNYNPQMLVGIDPGMRAVCTAAREVLLKDATIPRTRRRSARRRRRRGRASRTGGFPHWIRRPKITSRNAEKPVEVISVTSREYHHLAGFNRFNAFHTSQKQQHAEYALVIKEMPSFKTSGYTSYLKRLAYFWKHLPFLLRFSEEHKYKKWRFYRQRMARVAIDAIAERVVPAVSVRNCVAYGDWSGGSGIRGHPASPVKKLKAALKKRALVIIMNEFMTSKLCSRCHQRLAQVRYPKLVYPRGVERPKRRRINGRAVPRDTSRGALRVEVCHAVLRCENAECTAQYWNRDANAAINILELLKSKLRGHGRIPAFRRREHDQHSGNRL